jgi:hypothetical protein
MIVFRFCNAKFSGQLVPEIFDEYFLEQEVED